MYAGQFLELKAVRFAALEKTDNYGLERKAPEDRVVNIPSTSNFRSLKLHRTRRNKRQLFIGKPRFRVR